MVSRGTRKHSVPDPPSKRGARRKPGPTHADCGPLLTRMAGALKRVREATATGDLKRFGTAVRDLRNACIVAEVALQKAVQRERRLLGEKFLNADHVRFAHRCD